MSTTRALWKYSIHAGINGISMPAGAEITSCAIVSGNPVVYALVDPSEATLSTKWIHAIATGQPFEIAECGRFIGTLVVNLSYQDFVLHIFEGA